MLTAPNLMGLDYLEHGFLNSDESQLFTKAHKKKLLLLKQVHDDNVIFATSIDVGQDVEADAMVAIEPGLILGIKTADCVPVLLAAKTGPIVAAAHAGWKGALRGVIKSTVKAMCRLGVKADDIIAAIGPCIRMPDYEVGKDFYDAFMKHDPESEVFFTPDKTHFDLPGYVKSKLFEMDVTTVIDTEINTFVATDFNSFRRDPKSPKRNLSYITIKT